MSEPFSSPTPGLPKGPPDAIGLYDPSHEHDACGVGFVVDIKGRALARDRQQALQVLINLLHRGACGCEVNTGDGAGILIQMPDRFLRKVARRWASRCRRPASTAPAWCSCRATRRTRGQPSSARSSAIVAEEGQTLLGWRDVPTDDRLVGARARSPSSRSSSRSSSGRRRVGAGRTPRRRARVRAQAVRHPQADRARGRRARRSPTRRRSSSTSQPVVATR